VHEANLKLAVLIANVHRRFCELHSRPRLSSTHQKVMLDNEWMACRASSNFAHPVVLILHCVTGTVKTGLVGKASTRAAGRWLRR